MDAGGATRDRFRILSIDGGGIRGLIAARLIAELELLVSEAAGEERRIADCFHMLAGTSTGGLIALGLTAPDPKRPGRPRLSGEDLVRLYLEDGPKIFRRGLLRRLLTAGGWLGPKHSPTALEAALRDRLGGSSLAASLREVIVTSYDMAEPGPHFFKRWRARQAEDRDPSIVDAALATASAPTYFPSYELKDRALVDGGVFAANPTVAAVAEALKRAQGEPSALTTADLLVVSLGTGQHEIPYIHTRVRRWGRLAWIWPRAGEAPLIGAFLDGQADAAHHWAEVLLNHEPGTPMPAPQEMGEGPSYFRFQLPLPAGFELDDARPDRLAGLLAAAERLVEERRQTLTELGRRLAAQDPLPADAQPLSGRSAES